MLMVAGSLLGVLTAVITRKVAVKDDRRYEQRRLVFFLSVVILALAARHSGFSDDIGWIAVGINLLTLVIVAHLLGHPKNHSHKKRDLK